MASNFIEYFKNMNTERLLYLRNDPRVIKINGWFTPRQFYYQKDNIVVLFSFNQIDNSFPAKKRIKISTYPLRNTPPPDTSILDDTLILVNNHEPNFSISYILKIDSKKRLIHCKIQDKPESDILRITDEESESIEIKY